MDTITISYQDRAVALAARRRVWLAAHVEALPDGHPTKRVVAFMALFARDVLCGELPAPYTDERALIFARLGLVDPDTYAAHYHDRDDDLAVVLEPRRRDPRRTPRPSARSRDPNGVSGADLRHRPGALRARAGRLRRPGDHR